MLRVARGGDDVTGATLTRFYALHVAVLPALTTAILGLHLFLVQKQGMSVPIKVEQDGSEKEVSHVGSLTTSGLAGATAGTGWHPVQAGYEPVMRRSCFLNRSKRRWG